VTVDIKSARRALLQVWTRLRAAVRPDRARPTSHRCARNCSAATRWSSMAERWQAATHWLGGALETPLAEAVRE